MLSSDWKILQRQKFNMANYTNPILFLSALVFILNGAHGFLPNLDCYPRPKVTPTTTDLSFQYFPYFVQLHHCAGSKGKIPPLFVRCVPEKVEKVVVEVDQKLLKRKVNVVLYNHTRCKTECILKKEDCKRPVDYNAEKCMCYCDAKAVGPPGLNCRDERKIWSSEKCGCVCKNSFPCKNSRKIFDQNTCSCKCKTRKKSCENSGRVYNLNTCGCMKTSRSEIQRPEDGESSRRGLAFWISAVVIELLLMLAIFEAILYSYKSGFIYDATKKIAGNPQKQETSENQVEMSYKEMLRRRSSRNSGALHNRSTRNSSVHPLPSPFLSSPGYDFSNEEVFTN